MLCAGLLLLILYPEEAGSGPYLNSAHGNSAYGVKRTATGFPSDYAQGLCAHCHEQHSSIGGAEPNPAGGPDRYVLFYSNHISQTENFCFKCHTDLSSYQTGGLINRSYSYRAGGYISDTLNNIKEAFSFTSPATSHNLGDIKTFISGKWGYTNDPNPCAGCHNPHRVQGDPANAGSSTKNSGARGWPVSRPSQHSKDNNAWGLWGDDASERMNFYTAGYQAPYRSGGDTYEPDGSATQNGSNLTDYVTFCTDCHNATNTILSTTKGRNLRKFDWNLEKHGKGSATDDSFTDVKAPYQDALLSNYVLSCTDCHEPHGSTNVFLIRKWVNNSTVTVTNPAETGVDGSVAWKALCIRCHMSDGTTSTHAAHTPDQTGYGCLDCHFPEPGNKRVCIECHYHGSTYVTLLLGQYLYKGGEHLF